MRLFECIGVIGVVLVSVALAGTRGQAERLDPAELVTVRGGCMPNEVCRHDVDPCPGCVQNCTGQDNGTGCGETEPERLGWRCQDYQGGAGCNLGPKLNGIWGKKCRCTNEVCGKTEETYRCSGEDPGAYDCDVQ